MSHITLGSRRLYDALGIETTTAGEINLAVTTEEGREIYFYLGPNPPHGKQLVEGCQYSIPGRASWILNANDKYDSPCFLEISIASRHEISDEKLSLLKSNDKGAKGELIQEAGKQSEHLLDAISGIVALLVHRQLVLKPLAETIFLTGDHIEPTASITGPIMELLEGIKTNQKTEPFIKNVLESTANQSYDALKKIGETMHWLLKAWRERDGVSKFVYLFIPLESVLQSGTSSKTDTQSEFEALEELVKNSDSSQKSSLLMFLERARTKFNPTLNTRFEEFARQASLPGWELDVQAFKKFNRMRNLLLHTGDRNLSELINFEEATRTLEDLVERYVSFALFGSAVVYSSKWRPSRTANTA